MKSLAIAALHPSLSPSARLAYARVLAVDPDPALLVSLVEHEARWRPSAVGGLDGQCIGLAQKCLRFVPACRSGFDAPACIQRRAELLDGVTALRVLVSDARAWRKLCGRRWTVGYAGFGTVAAPCGRGKVPRVVRDILAIRKRILGGQHG